MRKARQNLVKRMRQAVPGEGKRERLETRGVDQRIIWDVDQLVPLRVVEHRACEVPHGKSLGFGRDKARKAKRASQPSGKEEP